MTTVAVQDKFVEILTAFGDLQESVNLALQRYAAAIPNSKNLMEIGPVFGLLEPGFVLCDTNFVKKTALFKETGPIFASNLKLLDMPSNK